MCRRQVMQDLLALYLRTVQEAGSDMQPGSLTSESWRIHPRFARWIYFVHMLANVWSG